MIILNKLIWVYSSRLYYKVKQTKTNLQKYFHPSSFNHLMLYNYKRTCDVESKRKVSKWFKFWRRRQFFVSLSYLLVYKANIISFITPENLGEGGEGVRGEGGGGWQVALVYDWLCSQIANYIIRRLLFTTYGDRKRTQRTCTCTHHTCTCTQRMHFHPWARILRKQS